MDYLDELKWFYQRGKRGYAECDWWGMHDYMSKVIPPMLRRLKTGSGCPSEFYDRDATNNECHKWSTILEEMAQGFEAAAFLDNQRYLKWKPGEHGGSILETDHEAMENARLKMERGLKLFAEHYLSLWD
jgi:hypothetical protein